MRLHMDISQLTGINNIPNVEHSERVRGDAFCCFVYN